MIAVRVHRNVILEGLRLPEHRAVRVVEALADGQEADDRDVVTVGEARALVELGYAERLDSGVELLEAVAGLLPGRSAA
jgi:hypothetical protein